MLKIKVCGMKSPQNITELLELSPDYIGLIFHPASPRFVDNIMATYLEFLEKITKPVKTGVFVNQSKEYILKQIQTYSLAAIQLHGNETPEFCQNLKETVGNDIQLIKAFSIAQKQDFNLTSNYETSTDYFLFDTKTPTHGGSGQKFDWQLLTFYQGNKPYFLSGGIDSEDSQTIKNLRDDRLYALDLNSKFEITPAQKDITKLKLFISQLNVGH
jgi:phosphoribosylanthranilate isomerase